MDFEYKGVNTISDVMFVDESLPSVFGLSVESGQWFHAEDTIGGITPVVITKHLANELFGQEDPLGKVVVGDNGKRKVVGVMDHYRHKSAFQEDDNSMLAPAKAWDNTLLLKVKPAANNADYEAKLDHDLHQLGKDWGIEIQHLDNMKATQNKIILIPLLILTVVCGFLIFNVGLGLFGVLFQNISRRKGEIGIRRAIGATQTQVWRYFVGETLVIATFGVVLGVFFAAQIPLLHVLDVDTSVYLWGMFWAALSVYGIAIICSFYPSRQAAAIYPAVALHEE
jgi:putative ABC transport system permease protein